jgi:hypothetical protein
MVTATQKSKPKGTEKFHGTALSAPDVYRRQLNPVYRLPSTVYPLLEGAYRYGYG